MTSTPCQSAALDRIIALWTAMVVAFFGAIVETIATIADNVCNTLHELGACCRKAGRRLALRPRLSRPMSKLETLGHHSKPPRAEPSRRLVTILVPELNDAVGCVFLADIGAARTQTTDHRKDRSRGSRQGKRAG